MIQPPRNLRSFDSLLKIIEALHGPEGCPWDKEQTHRSLTPFAIEEAHELAEAIEAGDEREMILELGDLLLQVVHHTEIARLEGRFTLEDVLEGVNEKMVRRHPHVFSDTKVDGSDEVLNNWAKLKEAEKARKAEDAGQKTPARPAERFDIPVPLPALSRAHKIGAKTKEYRFDWSSWKDVLTKVEEELGELKEALEGDDRQHQEAELGDLLFSVAQLARHLDIEAEQALRTTNQRFEKRFFLMHRLATDDGRDFSQLSEAELEAYWQRAKERLNAK